MAIQGTPELRKKLKRFYREYWRVAAEIRHIEATHKYKAQVSIKGGKMQIHVPQPVLPKRPEFPEECRGMTCAAKTRKGTPCKITDLYDNGRCKFHGGASTGPKTKEGKKRSAMNGLKPKQRNRQEEIKASLPPSSRQRSEPHEVDKIQPRLPQGSDQTNSGANPMRQATFRQRPMTQAALRDKDEAKLMDC